MVPYESFWCLQRWRGISWACFRGVVHESEEESEAEKARLLLLLICLERLKTWLPLESNQDALYGLRELVKTKYAFEMPKILDRQNLRKPLEPNHEAMAKPKTTKADENHETWERDSLEVLQIDYRTDGALDFPNIHPSNSNRRTVGACFKCGHVGHWIR